MGNKTSIINLSLIFFQKVIKNFRIPHLVLVIWLYGIFSNHYWKNNDQYHLKPWKNKEIINNDIIVYYEYLPAFFIFHDPSFKFADNLPKQFNGKIWLVTGKDGKKYPKMTMGLSILYAPFFFAGHLSAKLLNYTADGYTMPYLFFLSFSGVFYAFIGLLFLEKTLKIYFSSLITSMVILSVGLATNLYFYTVYEGPLAHAHNFFLISVFLYYSIRWHEKTDYRTSIMLGFLFGLIFLIRPVNALVILIPVLYGIKDFKSLTSKIKLIFSNYLKILVALFFAFAAILPQLIFWKSISGNWFVYTYGKESFYFSNPHIVEGLISYRNGWLLYTPIMLFSIAGIFFLKKYLDELKLSIILFFCVNVYVVFSWWCWWYGGFSIRAMVDCYGILCIPQGAFYAKMLNIKYFKYLIFAVFAVFVYLNIFQTMQYTYLYVHYNSTTRNSYWSAFMKKQPPKNYWDLLKNPDHEAAVEGKEESQGAECFP